VIVLRDYQEKDIAAIRARFAQGSRRVGYAAPTGSGKTVLFVHVAHKAVALDQRVTIVVHRVELVDQTIAALVEEGIEYGIIAAGYPENPAALVQVAMAQTLVRRLERLDGVKFLIVDECHHILAATWIALAAAVPNARILGVTATPERLDGKGLSAAFDTLVIGPKVKDLITDGWLAPFAIFAPEHQVDLKRLRTVGGDYALGPLAERMNTDAVTADAIAEYRKHLDGQSALAFCATIAHSQATARAFRTAGINAVHLDGDTPVAERRDIIARLGSEPFVVCNCGIISEGLNVPVVGGVILLRPTRSLALHLQQIGRALRPAPGKARAVILDHAGNVYRHGFPDLEHAWSLEGRPKKKGKALVKRCKDCGALIPAAARECPECGAVQPAPAAPPTRAGSRPLIELDALSAHERWLVTGSFRAVVEWAGFNEARLRQVAKARGYKPGWVFFRLQAAREANEDMLARAIWG
jgi:superfamily II DNA or RNA helicase